MQILERIIIKNEIVVAISEAVGSKKRSGFMDMIAACRVLGNEDEQSRRYVARFAALPEKTAAPVEKKASSAEK